MIAREPIRTRPRAVLTPRGVARPWPAGQGHRHSGWQPPAGAGDTCSFLGSPSCVAQTTRALQSGDFLGKAVKASSEPCLFLETFSLTLSTPVHNHPKPGAPWWRPSVRGQPWRSSDGEQGRGSRGHTDGGQGPAGFPPVRDFKAQERLPGPAYRRWRSRGRGFLAPPVCHRPHRCSRRPPAQTHWRCISRAACFWGVQSCRPAARESNVGAADRKQGPCTRPRGTRRLWSPGPARKSPALLRPLLQPSARRCVTFAICHTCFSDARRGARGTAALWPGRHPLHRPARGRSSDGDQTRRSPRG